MSDIAKVVGGGTPKSDDPANFDENGHPWITPADLSGFDGMHITHGRRSLSAQGLRSCSAVPLPAGTVLFTSRAPIGYVAIAANEIATNQGFRSFVLRQGMIPEYVYFYMRTMKPLAEQVASGTTFLEISGTNAGKLPIVIPPTNEQRRIAAKLEQVLSLVDNCLARFEQIPSLLKRFRQSVLAAACFGRLTEDWREIHRPLCAIPQPVKDEELPSGWQATTLGRLSTFVTSGSRGWAAYYSDSGPLFLRSQDINTDRLVLDGAAHVQPPAGAEGARTRIRKGDLLVTITGANVTKSAVVENEPPEAYINQHVGLVRLSEIENASYLHLWLTSPAHGRAQLLEAAYGAGKPGLNLTNLRNVAVFLPPADEQQEIVRRVIALFGIADLVAERYSQAKHHVDRLTQSILAKAFRGELVPQDPNDEPATALLARIQSDRQPAAVRSRGRRGEE